MTLILRAKTTQNVYVYFAGFNQFGEVQTTFNLEEALDLSDKGAAAMNIQNKVNYCNSVYKFDLEEVVETKVIEIKPVTGVDIPVYVEGYRSNERIKTCYDREKALTDRRMGENFFNSLVEQLTEDGKYDFEVRTIKTVATRH